VASTRIFAVILQVTTLAKAEDGTEVGVGPNRKNELIELLSRI